MSPSAARGTTTVAELGEFGLVDVLTADLPGAPEVLLGPGDDGAVLDLPGPLVTSLDVLVENVHFRTGWSDPGDIGRKAVAVNVADLEAMGARPVALLLGLSVPPQTQLRWVRELADGLRAECVSAGVVLVGGDVTRARDITLSVTVLGSLDSRAPVRRDGARDGDVVALRGRTGWAAAGLVVLGRGFRSPRAVVAAQKTPEVPYGAGVEAARAGATSMVDVSDGLLADLGHVARASDVVIDLRAEAFVVPEPLQTVAAATGADPLTLILTGGEDHALAATFPPGAVPEGWDVVGEVLAAEVPGVLVDGAVWESAPGFTHFGGTG